MLFQSSKRVLSCGICVVAARAAFDTSVLVPVLVSASVFELSFSTSWEGTSDASDASDVRTSPSLGGWVLAGSVHTWLRH